MIKSMTGYGRHKEKIGNLDITVEVRCVNNRYLDCGAKLPRAFIFAEEAIKNMVQSYISRGKIDIFVSIDSSQANMVKISLNRPLLQGYLTAMREMVMDFDVRDDISVSTLSRFSDLFQVEKEEADTQAVTEDICKVLKGAMDSFAQMRQTEGLTLKNDIQERLVTIRSIVGQVQERYPEAVEEYRSKLYTRMCEVLENTSIDESRILTEAALFADKTAIDEEIVRLKSHLSQLDEMLETGGAVGRKLDFLLQELNREVNTIGSKGNDIQQAKHVVELKAELEKIREQIQNIE